MAIKIISNIVVIVLNYILSKFIIFKKKDENPTSSEGEK
jgi:putative flippase GtrA